MDMYSLLIFLFCAANNDNAYGSFWTFTVEVYLAVMWYQCSQITVDWMHKSVKTEPSTVCACAKILCWIYVFFHDVVFQKKKIPYSNPNNILT